MVKGLQLTLLIGPAVPLPVPRVVLDALERVTVVNAGGETASGFELTFKLSHDSPLHTLFLLAGGGSIPPIFRVVLIATVNGTPQPLIDGVMTEHSFSPGSGGGEGRLTVRGEDLTRVMDFIDFSGLPYPAMPVEARVAVILAKYAVLGVIPLVIPTVLTDVPLPTDRIPVQRGKDLPYIRQLARQVGYVFYLEPGPAPATSVAYFGPEVKVGVPQPALSMNMGHATNVESISFRFDGDGRTQPVLFVQNPLTKVPLPIPVPNVSLLNPSLAAVPPLPKQIEPIRDVAKLNPIQAALRGLARSSQSADVVTGDGTLDVLRYGRVLKARGLVGVRGAGPAFDGLFYVKRVTHTIERGSYKQSFTLTRDGLLSTLPNVPV